MERKNTVLLTVIAVATLLVAVIGATFAYFTATTGGSGTTPTTVTTSSQASSTFVGTSLTLSVLASDMQKSAGKNDWTVYKEATGASATSFSMSVPSSSTAQKETCPIKVTFTPNTTGYDAYTMTSGATKEYTLLFKENLTNATLTSPVYAGTLLTATDNNKLDNGWRELNLSGITAATDLMTGSAVITGNTTGAVNGSVSYDLKLRFYNLGIDQNSNTGKSFGGTITFTSTSNCVASNA